MTHESSSVPKPILSCRNLGKVYESDGVKTVGLNGVNLDFYPGELVVVMSPSGGGKSTLLNLLGLLLKPTTGGIILNGRGLAGKSSSFLARTRQQHFSYLMQNFALIEDRKVSYNLTLPLLYRNDKRSRAEIHAQIEAYLTRLGLDDEPDILKKRVRALSGGQKQRIALIRAMLTEPDIILADEPTGSLDSANSYLIGKLLRDRADEGVAVIMATHDPLMTQFADRLIRLRDGEVLEQLEAPFEEVQHEN